MSKNHKTCELADAQKRMRSIQEKFPRSDAYLNVYQDHCSASFYPDGICGKRGHVRTTGKTLMATLDALDEAWRAFERDHAIARTADMAEAIMRVTFRLGTCTDAALRGEGFSQDEIVALGSDAIDKANAIGALAPFAIIKHDAKANDYSEAAE